MNYLMNGLAALAFIVLFSQCAGKTDNQTTNAPAQANAELSGMKIAYVEIDTLLAKYNFCIDLNEAMVKKSENVRMTLNQKATSLNKEKQDFQKKVENNAFLSQDRAQQEYNRLVKLEQDLQELSNKLQNGLMEENPPIMSGVATTTSKSNHPSFWILGMSSSPPTKSAPAASASATLSPFANTRTRTVLPVP